MKTKVLISCAVTAQLICVFVYAYAKSRFSYNAAQIICGTKEYLEGLDTLTSIAFLLSTIHLLLYRWTSTKLLKSFDYQCSILHRIVSGPGHLTHCLCCTCLDAKLTHYCKDQSVLGINNKIKMTYFVLFHLHVYSKRYNACRFLWSIL